MDGTVDFHGKPAIKAKTGRWTAGTIILVNQGLVTLAFFGVGVNLVLYLTRVLQQGNAEAANSVSKWTGTVYIFSLVGAFLSDSYWGRYKTCAIFQAIFVLGLGGLSVASSMFLITPKGCGDRTTICSTHSSWEIGLFYISIYMIALNRFCQVFVAASKKWRVKLPQGKECLFEEEKDTSLSTGRKILHTHEFKFLDKAAYITSRDFNDPKENTHNPWTLCPISQVEEVKCILRLLPIWLCTIIYSVVFTQMASLFVEQGAAMKSTISGFQIPASSMSSFDILSVALFIFLNRRVITPLVLMFKKKDSKGLTELQRMGIGLIIAILSMVSAGIVECFRLKYANQDCPHCDASSSLSIFWQVPQYAFVGASEVFMYVGQLEFFNAQAPDALKSFGSALCMTSISLGNYVSSFIVTIVMKISTEDDMPGWIPGNLNRGHLDRFFFLLAGLTAVDLLVYIVFAKWYKSIKLEGKNGDENDSDDSEIV
ncbi:putative proton-dependent oligopeptide transporter family, MFS transporter superfamily [Helianthus annuus]|nr:putative proton-dependent oligopeptide transporter family, MFS transporter superfamily [Helianthus annuus]KAJ0739667.1 putative proton-dependent oligopeptide transporter family, MFS transporter superfamily [Helianthus annuus]